MKTRDRDKPDEGNVGRPNGEDIGAKVSYWKEKHFKVSQNCLIKVKIGSSFLLTVMNARWCLRRWVSSLTGTLFNIMNFRKIKQD